MIFSALDLAEENIDLLWSYWVVFVRVTALVSFAPVLGEQSIPMRVRLGVSVAFTMIVAPAVLQNSVTIPDTNLAIIAVTLPEIVAGAFFGILLRFFIFALQIAGSIAAQSTSLSQIFGGSAGADPQPAISHILVAAGLALASLMGLHVQLAVYLVQTYELVPQGVLITPQSVLEFGLPVVSKIFALGLTLAAPFVLASFIYNVTLGIINKAMPQLMVSFVGAPAITAGGLLLLFLSAPLLLSVWFGLFSDFMMSTGVR